MPDWPSIPPGSPAAPARLLVESPWVNLDQLEAVVLAELFGAGLAPLSRAEAMRVPAVARARHLIAPTIARLPLRAYLGAAEVTPQPTWTQRTDGAVSPFHRMCWTVDDCLFYGWSLWRVDRGADNQPKTAARVPRDRWDFDAEGQVVDVDGQPMPAANLVLIPGPHEGILTFGTGAVRDAASLQRSARRSAANPTPAVELHQTNQAPMGRPEIDALIRDWTKARSSEAGGVAYTPAQIELRTHGQPAESLLIDGRNAAAVDVARVVGLPAAMLDATNAGASLTYETQQGRNAEFLDYGLAAYMTAISARLSMDDVVPRGQRIAFDAEELLGVVPGTSGAVTDD